MSKLPPEFLEEPELGPSLPDAEQPSVAGARKMLWASRRQSLAGYWRTFRRSRQGVIGLTVLLVFVIIALTAPLWITPADISPAAATGPVLHPPNFSYPLGTDIFGRSVLDMVCWGARISLLVGFTATIGTMLIGSVIGIAAGYYGGRTDSILGAVTNWFLVLPWLALAIVIASTNPFKLPPTGNVILVIAITSWAGTARLVRAQALSVKERGYVERSRALGGGNWHLVTRHVLPNVMPVIFANTVLTVAIAILSEAALGFLGIGDPASVSWGTMLNQSYDAGSLTAGYWWWFIPPGLAIVFVCLSVTLCGYALDEILNPKLRNR